MSGISLRIHHDNLPTIAASLAPRARQINRKTAFDILADTAAATPVDTGALRASWHVEDDSGTAVVMGTNSDYAIYVELGARGRPGHFMLTRAVEKNRAGHLAALRQLVG